MSITRSRANMFVKGLGNFETIIKEPTAETDFNVLSFIRSFIMSDTHEMEEMMADNGQLLDALSKSQKVTAQINLMETSKTHIDYLKNSVGKVNAVRYHGMSSPLKFQYFCMDKCRFNPSNVLEFKPGARDLPLGVYVIYQDLGYSIAPPLIYVVEGDAAIETNGLQLWISPTSKYGQGGDHAFDVSGFERHATLTSANVWLVSGDLYTLRFDGTASAATLGNVVDIATEDFIIEAWIRIQAANASTVHIGGKKTSGGVNAGFLLQRASTNVVRFSIADGTTEINPSTTSTLLQNVWAQAAIVGDRDGNAQMYLNGAANGSPVSMAAIGSLSNALAFRLGRNDTGNFGQVDIGDVRVNKYTAGSLPSNAATIVANNFAADRNKYGI